MGDEHQCVGPQKRRPLIVPARALMTCVQLLAMAIKTQNFKYH